MSQAKRGTKTTRQRPEVDAVMAARRKAHKVFDSLWQGGFMSRKEAYKWLTKELGWPPQNVHMAQMNRAQCQKVIECATSYIQLSV